MKAGLSLEAMMWITAAALLLPALGGVFFFGMRALLIILTCVISAVVFEIICKQLRGIKSGAGDGSAVVTGLILALVIPPSFPLWAAVIGSCFSICIVKHVFGGIGKNIFNPALMGRAFLTAAFPVLITTYTIVPRALPLNISEGAGITVDSETSATPMSRIKFEGKNEDSGRSLHYFLGSRKGSTGETSGFLILIGLVILLAYKVADWRLPASYFGTVLGFSTLLWFIDPAKYLNPLMTILLGGILLGGTYMVTDPVTTPVTGLGKIVFGAGAGIITVVIRNWSGYPEGVMFSIILMNAVTPLINRYTRPRIYGT